MCEHGKNKGAAVANQRLDLYVFGLSHLATEIMMFSASYTENFLDHLIICSRVNLDDRANSECNKLTTLVFLN